jgi:hypothetical protein
MAPPSNVRVFPGRIHPPNTFLLSKSFIGITSAASIVAFGADKQLRLVSTYTSLHLHTNPRVESLKERTIPSSQPYPSIGWAAQTLCIADHPRHDQDKFQGAALNASLNTRATSSSSTLFPPSGVRAGTHVILIGSY